MAVIPAWIFKTNRRQNQFYLRVQCFFGTNRCTILCQINLCEFRVSWIKPRPTYKFVFYVDDKILCIIFSKNNLIKIHEKKCIRVTPMKRVNFCTRNSAVACCCCSLFFPIMHSYKTERLDNYTATLPNTILLELCRAVRQPTAAAATTY